jgi:hypothetical protein
MNRSVIPRTRLHPMVGKAVAMTAVEAPLPSGATTMPLGPASKVEGVFLQVLR